MFLALGCLLLLASAKVYSAAMACGKCISKTDCTGNTCVFVFLVFWPKNKKIQKQRQEETFPLFIFSKLYFFFKIGLLIFLSRNKNLHFEFFSGKLNQKLGRRKKFVSGFDVGSICRTRLLHVGSETRDLKVIVF